MLLTLVLYCAAILLASLVGGWIPLWIRLTHERMEVAVSFVAGVMLGVGVFHMMPHAFHELGSMDQLVGWMMAGLLAMFFVERFFRFHHHDTTDVTRAAPSVDDPATCSHPHPEGHSLEWGGALTGLTLHTLLAGVALAASVQAEWQDDHATSLAGFGTFLVIFLHKPLDSMTIGTLMASGGRSARIRHVVNALFALVIPLGVCFFHLGLGIGSDSGSALVGCALAFSAGTFLCISLSDLLPELQFHRHDRVKLSLALLLGLAVAYAIGFFETCGHDHNVHKPPLNENHGPGCTGDHDH